MKKVVWLLKEYERGEYSSAIIYWYGILEQLGYSVVYYPYEDYEPNSFYFEMKKYKPDYILHACYDKLHLEFARLREFCKVYVVQSDDDWRFENYAKYYIPFVDGTISYQAEKQWYLNNGAKDYQIISARWAFNPNTMMLEQPCKTKDILVSHGGSLYGDREYLIQQFINKGISVSVASQVKYGELLNLWDRSKFSLCFTKASQGNFRQKKGRVAEIGYHSVLVSEPFPQIDEYYEPGVDFILFETVDEAIDRIKYYESNPQDYHKMLESSRARVWNSNTVYHEWDHIMSVIDDNYTKQNINKILKKFND